MKKLKKTTKIFSIIILISLTIYIFYFINKNNTINKSFIVNRQSISFTNLPSNFDNYKILEIADLHSMEFGKNNKNLISEINKLSPDIILVTGDMFSASELKKSDGTYDRNYNEESLPGFQLLKNLSQKYTVIYSTGNHEEGIDAIYNGNNWDLRNRNIDNAYNRYINKLTNFGVKFVNNNKTKIIKNGQSINIYGIYYSFLDEYANNNFLKYSSSSDFLNNIDNSQFNVLLCHNPNGAEILKDKNFDLILSGHVHGGIIRLFDKGILDPARKLFPKYNKGLYQINNTKLFVSAGLGNTKFIRINNSPEINLITLQKTN